MTLEGANVQLKELYKLRKEQESVIKRINRFHAKLSQVGPEQVEKYYDQLCSHYAKAKVLAESEASASRLCMEQLAGLLTPGQITVNGRKRADAGDQKRKRMKSDADSSRLSSPTFPRTPVANSGIVPGDQVAARVTADDAENHEWIVVKVTRYDRDTNKYEVIDEEPDDDAESGQQRKYKLPASCIIPFPKKADASSAPEFLPGSQVLAVYPHTTALYKASVVGPHRKKRSDDYLLEFDGDEEEGTDGLPKRQVSFFHVVQLPDGHRQ
ncbi:hypothetical protein CY35_02G186600 [Sphagnum magellanicum]|jgi:SAGA-associated factor 29|nr:hypothetical protein CY35_02G186600 [Sphagnum magellanicum]